MPCKAARASCCCPVWNKKVPLACSEYGAAIEHAACSENGAAAKTGRCPAAIDIWRIARCEHKLPGRIDTRGVEGARPENARKFNVQPQVLGHPYKVAEGKLVEPPKCGNRGCCRAGFKGIEARDVQDEIRIRGVGYQYALED